MCSHIYASRTSFLWRWPCCLPRQQQATLSPANVDAIILSKKRAYCLHSCRWSCIKSQRKHQKSPWPMILQISIELLCQVEPHHTPICHFSTCPTLSQHMHVHIIHTYMPTHNYTNMTRHCTHIKTWVRQVLAICVKWVCKVWFATICLSAGFKKDSD